MSSKFIHKFLIYSIGLVWLTNGLLCKVLNLVPRHEQIVARILGNTYSRPFTIAIGFSEIFMAIWIISKYKMRINAITQITIVAIMNTLEFIIAPDLLLWGKWNAAFALLFILIVYINQFYFIKKLS